MKKKAVEKNISTAILIFVVFVLFGYMLQFLAFRAVDAILILLALIGSIIITLLLVINNTLKYNAKKR